MSLAAEVYSRAEHAHDEHFSDDLRGLMKAKARDQSACGWAIDIPEVWSEQGKETLRVGQPDGGFPAHIGAGSAFWCPDPEPPLTPEEELNRVDLEQYEKKERPPPIWIWKTTGSTGAGEESSLPPCPGHLPRIEDTKECCPDVRFPSYIDIEDVPVSSAFGSAWRVGFYFGVWLRYLDNADCACECCVFKQFVSLDHRYAGLGWLPWPRKEAEASEDCNVVGKDGKQYGGALRTPLHKGTEWDCIAPDTYKAALEKGSGALTGRTEVGCTIQYDDAPFRDIRPLAFVRLKWLFIGRVYDRCHKYIPRVTRAFEVERHGWVLRGGTATVDRAAAVGVNNQILADLPMGTAAPPRGQGD
jgi:hypothetical protein